MPPCVFRECVCPVDRAWTCVSLPACPPACEDQADRLAGGYGADTSGMLEAEQLEAEIDFSTLKVEGEEEGEEEGGEEEGGEGSPDTRLADFAMLVGGGGDDADEEEGEDDEAAAASLVAEVAAEMAAEVAARAAQAAPPDEPPSSVEPRLATTPQCRADAPPLDSPPEAPLESPPPSEAVEPPEEAPSEGLPAPPPEAPPEALSQALTAPPPDVPSDATEAPEAGGDAFAHEAVDGLPGDVDGPDGSVKQCMPSAPPPEHNSGLAQLPPLE